MRLTFIDKKILTSAGDVMACVFRPDRPLHFIPGQFVQLKKIGDAQKNARAFSMASASDAETITFLMKHLADGIISGFLATAPYGTEIEAGDVHGKFVCDARDTDRVYVATGTGLAPIMSFITSLSSVPCTTLFGVRDRTHLFWIDRLPHPNIITLSRGDDVWTGAHGRVTEHVPAVHAAHPHAAWYLCGNSEMIKEVRAQLLTAGVAPTLIHFEIY